MQSKPQAPVQTTPPLGSPAALSAADARLPWHMGNAQKWEAASAGWRRQAALCDTFMDAMAADQAAAAWRNLRAGQMPPKVLAHWLHGYSKTRVPAQDHGAFAAADDDGVGWDMPACAHYTGAGLVLPEQIGGDFDARVQFMCTHFAPGVALELAAIAMGPQRYMGGQSHKGSGNKEDFDLVFDVHGTPPYVSAECDEDNGFRIGWNTAYSVTEFVPSAPGNKEAQAQSANLFNAYGANSAPAHWPQPTQWHGLRLMRRGHQFACLFQPQCQGPWRCAGEVRHSAMPWAIHLRLAAKHWTKMGRIAPATRIRWRHFELWQPIASAPMLTSSVASDSSEPSPGLGR